MIKFRIRTLLFVIIVFFMKNESYSQLAVDSLYLELANAENDTMRVDILNKISREYRISDSYKALNYNNRALDLANKLNYQPGMARTYCLLGTIYRYRGDNLLALKNYNKAQELYKQIDDRLGSADVFNYIGQIYAGINQLDKALFYYNKSYQLIKNESNQRKLAIVLNNIGTIYNDQNKDSLALINYKKAYEINEKLGRYIGMGFASMNIGNIYFSQNLHDKAKKYYFLSLKNMQQTNHQKGLIDININLANYHMYTHQFDSANYYLLKCEKMVTRFNMLGEKAELAKAFSKLYSLQGNCEKEKESLYDYINISDSLFSNNLSTKILEIERKFEYEKEIKDQKFKLIEKTRKLKIKELQIAILLIVIIAIIIIGLILISKKRVKIKYIDEKLAVKNNELISLAIYIIQKNDLIHSFRKQLLKLKNRMKVEDNKLGIEELINSIIFKIAISKDIEKFRDSLRELSKEFYTKLEQKFAGLNEKEKQLATLLRLNLTSKQIAVILNIEPDSVDMSRYRLRKKMNLPSNTNLNEFFNQI